MCKFENKHVDIPFSAHDPFTVCSHQQSGKPNNVNIIRQQVNQRRKKKKKKKITKKKKNKPKGLNRIVKIEKS